jgi:hypothetical protein
MEESEDQRPGERAPAGEERGVRRRFFAVQVAAAFDVGVDRVEWAMAGEFGLDAGGTVDSRQAQHLAEVLLGDLPSGAIQSGLMRLGAFTPRTDDAWGLGDTAPGEESDRLAARADRPADELASKRSSYDPSYPAE